ncbi:Kup system potassium uptake protein [Minicystis rosea]|nr:Kup system potassium uptake protein [Minicystis rosea]
MLLLLLSFNLPFFGANLTKLVQGGYVPLVAAVVVFSLMSTWKRRRVLLGRRLREAAMRSRAWFERLLADGARRVPGTAVFLTATPIGIPRSCCTTRSTRALHDTVLLVTVLTEHVPRVPLEESVEVRDLGRGMHRCSSTPGSCRRPTSGARSSGSRWITSRSISAWSPISSAGAAPRDEQGRDEGHARAALCVHGAQRGEPRCV